MSTSLHRRFPPSPGRAEAAVRVARHRRCGPVPTVWGASTSRIALIGLTGLWPGGQVRSAGGAGRLTTSVRVPAPDGARCRQLVSAPRIGPSGDQCNVTLTASTASTNSPWVSMSATSSMSSAM